MYIYEDGDVLYLHTGPHQGHFLSNIRANPRICVQVNETGPMQRGQPSPCNSALVYKSVVAYGTVRVVEDPSADEKKTWFLDRLLERRNQAMSAYDKPGYPMLDRIILYEVTIEIIHWQAE
jgi:nitroimidazol reductase NimA-like FMN-containing flavoprotein (pyridoxamine 5'-phosphate oxidase superfamily)